MTVLEKNFEQIDGFRDDVVKLQAALSSRVALGPENGGSGEHEKVRFIHGLLKAHKPDVLKEIRREFVKQTKMYPFKSRIPEDTVPPTDLYAMLMNKYRPLMEPYYIEADINPIGPEIS